MEFIEAEGIAEWVGQRVDVNYWGEHYKAYGILDNNKLVCGVVYSNYRGRDCEVSIAAEGKWCTRKNLKTFLDYPFEVLGCERITAICKKKNKQGRRFVERLGFKLEGNARKAFPDDDAIIYGFLKEEYEEWVKAHHPHQVHNS